MPAKIDRLIINSAFREPETHWRYDAHRQSFLQAEGRRPAGYFATASGASRYNDPGVFIELPLVNAIRPLVKSWRAEGWPGATGVTRKLLEYWHDREARTYPFFFCQLDALETLIWLAEAPATARAGLNIPGDGGPFRRLCTKLCTGGGKTAVMALLIAWQVCNQAAYPRDARFSKNIFIAAPGLTVKNRLRVLLPGGRDSYYAQFGIVPPGLTEALNQAQVRVVNWQALAWESEAALRQRKSVDKRGAKSDEAYVRGILGGSADGRPWLVINDEAHHAWRRNPENKVKLTGEAKEAEKQATIWVSGLDRLHKARGIAVCYDFSATPFAPSGKKNDEEALFGWIVSDFGLNDGIESGLVKTPRVVVRDDAAPDAASFRSKLYHIYVDNTVRDDINRPAAPEEPLPDLLNQAYALLGQDWRETWKNWRDQDSPVPPVLITVANRTETAARIKYAFDHKRIPVAELCEPEYTLHIDTKTLEAAEDATEPAVTEEEEDRSARLSKKEAAARLRETVDTVGQKGRRGENIRNVISVGMLTEGWDAKTVTHIMGLRAFSSQLLCEQVVGRGLRRRSYDLEEGSELFSPEYVNIFGIPFTFLPHEGNDDDDIRPSKPKAQIEALKERAEDFQIAWPNILRLDRTLRPKLTADLENIDPLVLEAGDTRLWAELAPVVDGQTDLQKCSEIDLEKLDRHLRRQQVVFKVAGEVFELMRGQKGNWANEANIYALLGQIIRLTEEYLDSGRIGVNPPLFNTSPLRRRLLYMLNMNKIVQHLWKFIRLDMTEGITPVFGEGKKTRTTGDMATWFTSKPCQVTRKSHISHCVYDSAWEAAEAWLLERNPAVTAWAKNDHLGFEIVYVFDGVVRKYYPDFLIRLENDTMLVLETKGQETRRDQAKRQALAEWTAAVNELRDYGLWVSDVSRNVKDVDGIIGKYLTANNNGKNDE